AICGQPPQAAPCASASTRLCPLASSTGPRCIPHPDSRGSPAQASAPFLPIVRFLRIAHPDCHSRSRCSHPYLTSFGFDSWITRSPDHPIRPICIPGGPPSSPFIPTHPRRWPFHPRRSVQQWVVILARFLWSITSIQVHHVHPGPGIVLVFPTTEYQLPNTNYQVPPSAC